MAKPPVRPLSALLVAALALTGGGCGGDETVVSYRTPKSAESTPRGPARVGEYRVLGFIYPADDPSWFFKLAGKTEELAKYEADFDKLAASVQVATGDNTPKFDLPAGWVRGGPRAGFAGAAETLKLPGSTLEVTITQSKGGLEGNVSRWAGQVGYAGDAVQSSRTVAAVGWKAVRVDVTGPKDPAAKGGPMMKGARR